MDEVMLAWVGSMLLLIVLTLVLLWGWSTIKSGRDRKPRQDGTWPAPATLGPVRYAVPPGGSWMHPHSTREGLARHQKAGQRQHANRQLVAVRRR